MTNNVRSKSTDKLEIMMDGIGKILEDMAVKEKVSVVSIKWESINCGDGESVVVPSLDINFK
jgi:hypothetical protein